MPLSYESNKHKFIQTVLWKFRYWFINYRLYTCTYTEIWTQRSICY